MFPRHPGGSSPETSLLLSQEPAKYKVVRREFFFGLNYNLSWIRTFRVHLELEVSTARNQVYKPRLVILSISDIGIFISVFVLVFYILDIWKISFCFIVNAVNWMKYFLYYFYMLLVCLRFFMLLAWVSCAISTLIDSGVFKVVASKRYYSFFTIHAQNFLAETFLWKQSSHSWNSCHSSVVFDGSFYSEMYANVFLNWRGIFEICCFFHSVSPFIVSCQKTFFYTSIL